MQRPLGIVFGSIAISCVLVLAGVLAVLVVRLKEGHSISIPYFAAAIALLVAACIIFGRIGFRLVKKRENEVGRASGRSLPSGTYFICTFLLIAIGMFLIAHFLTGPILYISLAALSPAVSSLVMGSPRMRSTDNQIKDQALASGTSPLGHESRSP
jgi:hypothetical protein